MLAMIRVGRAQTRVEKAHSGSGSNRMAAPCSSAPSQQPTGPRIGPIPMQHHDVTAVVGFSICRVEDRREGRGVGLELDLRPGLGKASPPHEDAASRIGWVASRRAHGGSVPDHRREPTHGSCRVRPHRRSESSGPSCDPAPPAEEEIGSRPVHTAQPASRAARSSAQRASPGRPRIWRRRGSAGS